MPQLPRLFVSKSKLQTAADAAPLTYISTQLSRVPVPCAGCQSLSLETPYSVFFPLRLLVPYYCRGLPLTLRPLTCQLFLVKTCSEGQPHPQNCASLSLSSSFSHSFASTSFQLRQHHQLTAPIPPFRIARLFVVCTQKVESLTRGAISLHNKPKSCDKTLVYHQHYNNHESRRSFRYFLSVNLNPQFAAQFSSQFACSPSWMA